MLWTAVPQVKQEAVIETAALFKNDRYFNDRELFRDEFSYALAYIMRQILCLLIMSTAGVRQISAGKCSRNHDREIQVVQSVVSYFHHVSGLRILRDICIHRSLNRIHHAAE